MLCDPYKQWIEQCDIEDLERADAIRRGDFSTEPNKPNNTMGTRASFFIGNPQDLEVREWLGCVAFDGYPDGFTGLEEIKTEDDFRQFVATQSERKDFAHPTRGFPFPWEDNLFLTDYTYAFFDGALRLTSFFSGFRTLPEFLAERDSEEERPDELPENCPAPKPYDRTQPDSIMVISAP